MQQQYYAAAECYYLYVSKNLTPICKYILLLNVYDISHITEKDYNHQNHTLCISFSETME